MPGPSRKRIMLGHQEGGLAAYAGAIMKAASARAIMKTDYVGPSRMPSIKGTSRMRFMSGPSWR